MSYVQKQPEGCWSWTGSTYEGGYGIFYLEGNYLGAHRAIYEHCFGIIGDRKWEVCHSCDNPNCVNPEHLFTALHQGNSFDMVQKGRAGNAKITPDEVRLIKARLATGEESQYIRKEYGLSQVQMWRLKNGQAWKEVN